MADGPTKFNNFFDRLTPDKELAILTVILPEIKEEAELAKKEIEEAVRLEEELKQIANDAETSAKNAETSGSLSEIVKETTELPVIKYEEAESAFKLAESQYLLAVSASISASQYRTITKTNTGSNKYNNIKVSVDTSVIEEAAKLSASVAALYAKAASSEKGTSSVSIKRMSSIKARFASQYAAFAYQFSTDLKDIALKYKDAYDTLVTKIATHIVKLEAYMKKKEGEQVNITLSQQALIASFKIAKKINQSIIVMQDKYGKNIKTIAQPVKEKTRSWWGSSSRGGKSIRKRKTIRRKNKRTKRNHI
jgi:hypothetical protein